MRIRDLDPADQGAVQATARLLVEGFRQRAPDAWPDMASALAEVRDSFGSDHISRVAVDGSGVVLGWVAAIREYGGHAWELHPLVVRPDRQRQGIGRSLVADLERLVRERGGTTLYLYTDDEDGSTSLGAVDLYPDPLAHLGSIRNLREHPFGFYAKLGFVISGVIPDANGPGKPDILMAKRVSGETTHVGQD